MKITKVSVYDLQTNEKQTFTFGTAADGKSVYTSKGSRLKKYLDFCFTEDSSLKDDVETEFSLNSDSFCLCKLHGEDGTTRSVLKKMVDGSWQVVARSRSIGYLEGIIGENVDAMLKNDYISPVSVQNFHGNLLIFDQIKMLADVEQSVMQSGDDVRKKKDDAVKKLQQYATTLATPVDFIDQSQVEQQLTQINEQINATNVAIAEAKAQLSANGIKADILTELDESQRKYNKLVAGQDAVNVLRQKVQLQNDVQVLIPKVKMLRSIDSERKNYEQKRYDLTSQIEYQESEIQSAKQQVEEKRQELIALQDKKTKIEQINNELTYIASLYTQNKQLNETLSKLNENLQNLLAEKSIYANRLQDIENTVAEVKEGLDEFKVPAKSIGELLETVRVDVKIDEVTSQIEKIQSEIAVKESQIAERESALVVQTKRFKSVADLDNAISPIKAKNTILQVLDSKYSKLETINTSLEEKRRNFERALEDYKDRIKQIDASVSKLQARLNHASLRKQEEFKREVYLNSQKTFSGDFSAVLAVNANLNDAETQGLSQEIETRKMDRELLVERAYILQGAVKEIKRHILINKAEMIALNTEKDNINKRYNEILSTNGSESAFNYIKALNADNGTQYLLDVQSDAVRGETELAELKRYTEQQRSRLSGLRERLKYLRNSQEQLQDVHTTIENIVTTNDQLKSELGDIGDRLSAGYEQYKSVAIQLENIESKIQDVQASIIETQKTIKVNQQQINLATDRAKQYAGGDDIEKAVSNFKYETGDAESEYNILNETTLSLQKDLVKLRVELEKTQWLYDVKNNEYNELYDELSVDFKVKGLDVEKISSISLDDNLDESRKIIANYDTQKSAIVEKIRNLYNVVKDESQDNALGEQIQLLQEKLNSLNSQKQTLLSQKQLAESQNAQANAVKARAAVVATEAKVLTSLSGTLATSKVVGLLIRDKINSTLEKAANYLNSVTEKSYSFSHQNYNLFVEFDGQKYAFDELDQQTQTAVYVSLVLNAPTSNVTDGKWLVFDEHTQIDKQILSSMLLDIGNVSYVTGYKKQKQQTKIVKVATEQQTED